MDSMTSKGKTRKAALAFAKIMSGEIPPPRQNAILTDIQSRKKKTKKARKPEWFAECVLTDSAGRRIQPKTLVVIQYF